MLNNTEHITILLQKRKRKIQYILPNIWSIKESCKWYSFQAYLAPLSTSYISGTVPILLISLPFPSISTYIQKQNGFYSDDVIDNFHWDSPLLRNVIIAEIKHFVRQSHNTYTVSNIQKHTKQINFKVK